VVGKNTLFTPEPVVTSIAFNYCKAMTIVVNALPGQVSTCSSYANQLVPISVIPPYAYQWQCSSVLLTNYTPVFLITAAQGLIGPLVIIFLRWLVTYLNRDTVKTDTRSEVEMTLPAKHVGPFSPAGQELQAPQASTSEIEEGMDERAAEPTTIAAAAPIGNGKGFVVAFVHKTILKSLPKLLHSADERVFLQTLAKQEEEEKAKKQTWVEFITCKEHIVKSKEELAEEEANKKTWFEFFTFSEHKKPVPVVEGSGEDVSEKQVSEEKKHIFVDPRSLFIGLINSIIILSTFGIVCPLLALALTALIVVQTYTLQILLGRFVHVETEATEAGSSYSTEEIKTLESECSEAPLRPLLDMSKYILFLSTIFLSFFLFDIVADANGAIPSIWAIVLLNAIVGVLVITQTFVDRYSAHAHAHSPAPSLPIQQAKEDEKENPTTKEL